MLVTLTPGQVVNAVVTPTAQGQPSKAVLSSLQFGSTDSTVFSVVQDPAVPNGCIITGVGSGSVLQASITFKATATEPDGVTTEVLQGKDDISCSLIVAQSPVADALVITLTGGTPTPPPVPSALSSLIRGS